MKLSLSIFIVAILAFGLIGCGEKSSSQTDKKPENSSEALGDPEQQSDGAQNSPQEATKRDKDARKPESGENKKSKESKITSIYTDLAEKKCKTTEINEQEEYSVQLCDGVAGYKLEVAEGDIRQTINVIVPGGKKHELKLWSVVSPAFSSVGKKAEWRVIKENGKIVPIALIVRFNASENPDDSSKITSYLTVSKITEASICVTGVIKPVKNANIRARTLADASARKPCISRRK